MDSFKRKRKDARIEFRVSAQTKELIERAALAKGLSVSAYTIATLIEDAKRTMERAERIELSNRDRDVFLSVLDQEPNESLRRSFEKYQAQLDDQ